MPNASPTWFYNNRHKLESVDGFPTPVSSVGQPRWLGKDLVDWIERPKLHRAGDAGTTIDFSAHLRERARRIASGGR